MPFLHLVQAVEVPEHYRHSELQRRQEKLSISANWPAGQVNTHSVAVIDLKKLTVPLLRQERHDVIAVPEQEAQAAWQSIGTQSVVLDTEPTGHVATQVLEAVFSKFAAQSMQVVEAI